MMCTSHMTMTESVTKISTTAQIGRKQDATIAVGNLKVCKGGAAL